MKKLISLFLCFSLLFCLSLNLFSQSAENELDQVELMKQFIGKWVTDQGGKVDTTMVWEVVPWEKGYLQTYLRQTKGESNQRYRGIIGFTEQYERVISYMLRTRGWIYKDYGKFESDNKIVYEGYNSSHTHVNHTIEYLFITPDKIKSIYKFRGSKDSWDDARVVEWTWRRVK